MSKDLDMSVIGVQNYKLLTNLVAPAKLGKKPICFWWGNFQNILLQLPQKLLSVSNFTQDFANLESVTAFVSKLHSITKSCNFGNTLETMLHD